MNPKNFKDNHTTEVAQNATNSLVNCQLSLFKDDRSEKSPQTNEAIWHNTCPHCGWGKAVERLFNGIHHSSLRCERCDRHLRWIKRSQSKLVKGGEA